MAPGRSSSVARSWYGRYHPADMEDNRTMRRADELGRFLRSRRARVEHEMVGLPPGDRRRVDGLRREGLARSLLLDPSERRHLFRLAAASEPTAGHGDGSLVRDGIRLLIDTLDRTPAVLLSRRLDLLLWNPIAEALLGPFADHRNYARMIFRDPAQRTLHADWEEAARQTAALLRYSAARHPEDDRLRALVADLDDAEPRFSHWWDAHDVAEKRHGAKTYLHPTAGELTLTYEALPMPDDGDQILTIYTVEPGTIEAERLAGLALRRRDGTQGA